MTARKPEDEDDEVGGRQHWVAIALVLWPSFLAASVASLLFFAAVDPQLLRDAGPRIFDNLNRDAGYALGFFFFWASMRACLWRCYRHSPCGSMKSTT